MVSIAKTASSSGTVVCMPLHTDEATFDGPALTLRRARTMIKVMRKAGAPDERLEPRGYGAQYPLSRDDTPAARARNERGSIAVEGG